MTAEHGTFAHRAVHLQCCADRAGVGRELLLGRRAGLGRGALLFAMRRDLDALLE